jgi:hypothetical protein
MAEAMGGAAHQRQTRGMRPNIVGVKAELAAGSGVNDQQGVDCAIPIVWEMYCAGVSEHPLLRYEAVQ